MVSQRPLTLLLAVLCIVALAVAGSTLSQTQSQTDAGGGGGVGSEKNVTINKNQTGGGTGFNALDFPFALFLAVLLAIGGAAIVWSLTVVDTRELLPLVVAGLVLIAALQIAVILMDDTPEWPFNKPVNNTTAIQEGGGEDSPENTGEAESDENDRTLSIPPLFGLVVPVIAVVVGVLVIHVSSSDSTASNDLDADTTTDDVALEGVGRAAGRAAAYIENDDADTTNAVYRAWREMTDAIDADTPATSTPGEFEDAAVDAGMDDERVTEITQLFEDVRYGPHPPSEERERRAVEALRDIEATHTAVSTAGLTDEADAGTNGQENDDER
jgi:hypothetical protein